MDSNFGFAPFVYLKLNNKEWAEYLYFMAVAAGKSSVCVYKFCLILLDLLCDSKVEMKVLLQRIQAGITQPGVGRWPQLGNQDFCFLFLSPSSKAGKNMFECNLIVHAPFIVFFFFLFSLYK